MAAAHGIGRLARRQALVVLAGAVVLGLLLGFLHVANDLTQERERMAEVRRSVATLMTEPAARAAYTLDTGLAEAVVGALLAVRPVVDAEVLDNLGRRLAGSGRPPADLPLRWLTDRLFGAELRDAILLRAGHPGEDGVRPVMGTLLVTLDTRLLADSFVRRVALLVAISLAHGLLLGLVLAVVSHALVTRPLTAVVADLEGVDPEAPTTIATSPRHARDELGRLVRAVNDLLRRVRDSLLELRRSRALNAGIVEHALDGIVTLDADGRIVEFNPAAERLFALPRARAVGRPAVPTLLPPRSGRALLQLSPAGRRVETDALRGDGGTFPAELSLSEVPIAEPRLVALHVRDLSERRAVEAERRRLEQELRRAEKLQALDTLAAGIAHDFNNILATIFASAEVALADLPEPSRAREAIARILESGQRGRELVGEIMAASRVERAAGMAIDLAETVAAACALQGGALPASIRLVCEVPPLQLLAMADDPQVHRIMANLCANAAQAMPQGGTLRVTLAAEDGSAALTVADTGTGMDPATAARLFEPFFTTKPVGEGTGLGLAVVHGVVKSLGGTIGFTTRPGEGTAFTIRLPLARPPTPRGHRPGASLDGTGRRVLLAIAEATLADSLAMALRACGFEVAAYRSPEDAFARMTASPGSWDVLIAAATLPGLSGLDLVDAARSLHGGVPAVLLAAPDDPGDSEDDALTDLVRLTTPLAWPELRDALAGLLSGRAPSGSVTGAATNETTSPRSRHLPETGCD